jgi:restriction endonuclease S subunit
MALTSFALQDLGKITQGITVSRYASDQGDTYRCVTVSDLENLYIKDVQNQVQVSIQNIQKYQLLKDDVVIAIRGTILKSSVVNYNLEGSIPNQNTVFFRSKSQRINPLYLVTLFRSEYFQKLSSFQEKLSTTTLPSIRVTDLRNLEIPLPDLDTQNQIAELFLSLEDIKKVTLSALEIRQKIAKAALFKSLSIAI